MLALIAGEGGLPGVLISRLEATGANYVLCEMEGYPCEAGAGRAVTRFRVEVLGSFIAGLKASGVSEVCFAGKVGRPQLDPSAIDAATMPLVPRMLTALQAGDDSTLRVALSFFEEAGIAVRGAHEIVPGLLPEAGVLGKHQPCDQDKHDAERGAAILLAMSQADVGQACIVAKGLALAVETLGGTDWMMRSLMHPTKALRDPELPPGGVLIKASKQGQDRRVDMPTIGPETLERAAEIGLRGIVIEAGGVMVLDLPTCIEIADGHDLFLWVRP